MTVLSCHPGSLNSFALKLKDDDSVHSLKTRTARKLAIPSEDVQIKYLYCDVYYTLDDEDDFGIFKERVSSTRESTLTLSSSSIPTRPPSLANLSSVPPSSVGPGAPHSPTSAHHGHGSKAHDASSIYSTSSNLYGRADPVDIRAGTSMHLIESSYTALRKAPSVKSAKSDETKSTKKPKSVAPIVPEHKTKFEEFHNQLGVRTFIGSIGPVENVRMMMKNGHRACYMSRAFAQQHQFIPKDAAPGFYGFSGITNLGSWPIKVGSKTVEQQVMLVENSYFPIILGRSFMERRGVRTDPLDQTSVTFMDTGESIPTDLVVVKDSSGEVIPIS